MIEQQVLAANSKLKQIDNYCKYFSYKKDLNYQNVFGYIENR